MKRIKTISVCVAGAVAIIAMFSFGNSPLRGQGAKSGTVIRGSISDVLEQFSASRSRDSHSTFEFTVRNDNHLDIGRLSILLQGVIYADPGSVLHSFVATGDDAMDVHSITFNAQNADAEYYFVDDYAPGTPNDLVRLNGYFYHTDNPNTTTVNLDPPIRLREGDAFLAVMYSTSENNGSGLISLRGTVPTPAGGDTLQIQ